MRYSRDDDDDNRNIVPKTHSIYNCRLKMISAHL